MNEPSGPPHDGREPQPLVTRFEAAFSVLMAAAAYLGRGNPNLVYPQALYLFLVIMALNLGAGLALQRWPRHPAVALAAILGNCAAVTGLLERSGGPESNLWVLYLLPIFSACLLLSGREVLWITLGAAAFNTAFTLGRSADAEGVGFLLLLKNGILALAAAVTWSVARRERQARRSLEVQREGMRRVMGRLSESERLLQDARKLADAGLLTAGLAHDINNVFAVILGHAEIARRQPGLDAEAARDLETIEKSSRLGRRIMENFMRLARRQTVPQGPCRLDEQILAALGLLDAQARRLGVQVQACFSPDLPQVLGEASSLQRLFLNLAGNALQAMPRGGRLSVTADRLPTPRGAGLVRVVFEDSGPGLPPEALERLFRPFATTRAEEGGHGLGLCVSQSIARRHGGALSAENSERGGARLSLLLPAASGEAA